MYGTPMKDRVEKLESEVARLKKAYAERDELILKLLVFVLKIQEPVRGEAVANQLESSEMETSELLSKANEAISWNDVTNPKCKGHGGGCGGA